MSGSSTAKDDVEYAENTPTGGAWQESPLTDSRTTNIQPQVNTALSVAESVMVKSATLRRVSVNPEEKKSSGLFTKKKSQEPSLVFTFTAEDVDNSKEAVVHDNVSRASNETLSKLMLKPQASVNETVKAESLVSYKTFNSDGSALNESQEKLRTQRFKQKTFKNRGKQHAKQG